MKVWNVLLMGEIWPQATTVDNMELRRLVIRGRSVQKPPQLDLDLWQRIKREKGSRLFR